MKVRRLNPPSHLLRAFSTVVRFGGVSKAAVDLEITQGGVTKQIQELERWLETPLFVRNGRKLELTEAGARYESAIRPLLEQLESATLSLISHSVNGDALHLSVMPTFNAKWLIPRLPDFKHQHPEIHVNFVPYVRGFDYRDLAIDASILFGDGKWPGANALYLEGREVVLVAPASARPALRQAKDVRDFELLRHVTAPSHWPRWQETQQLPRLHTLTGPQFDNYHSMIQAVVSGLGIALIPKCLVEDELSSGALIMPLESPSGGHLESELGYWLCVDAHRKPSQSLILFRNWLASQVELH